MQRSALLVEVPEAEPAVQAWRARLDPHAALGVPAHITVLFPFAAPPSVGADTLRTLGRLFGTVPIFDYRLVATRWFDEAVLWLAPDADSTFRRLTGLVSAAFPEYPPFGGQFPDVVPHLTVADRADVGDMRAAERQVQAQLPIRAVARSVSLVVELPTGRWKRAASFPFAPTSRSETSATRWAAHAR